MPENEYAAALKKRIEALLPGCEILKNDANLRQGILDWTILHGKKWAMLEVKAHAKAKERPNQDYFLKKFAKMGFAAKIYPENEEEVLAALQKALAPRRSTRVPKS